MFLRLILASIRKFIRLKNKIILFIEKKINPVRMKILAKAFGYDINLEKNVRIANKCKWHFGENSKLRLGDNVIIHSDCTLAVYRNSLLDIGDDSYIGPRTELLTRESIRIGHNTLIAQNRDKSKP